MESHYCRSTSKRKYVECGLSKAKLYRMYRQWDVTVKSSQPVSEFVYGQIFDYEFNISFHKPKKDLCDKCAEFENKEKNGILNDEEMLQKKTNM